MHVRSPPTWADTFIAIVTQGSCNCLNYWGEPEQAHIDHDNGPIVCMYVVSLTHLFVVHLFLRSVHPPEMLRVFRYIDVDHV